MINRYFNRKDKLECVLSKMIATGWEGNSDCHWSPSCSTSRSCQGEGRLWQLPTAASVPYPPQAYIRPIWLNDKTLPKWIESKDFTQVTKNTRLLHICTNLFANYFLILFVIHVYLVLTIIFLWGKYTEDSQKFRGAIITLKVLILGVKCKTRLLGFPSGYLEEIDNLLRSVMLFFNCTVSNIFGCGNEKCKTFL